MAGDVRTFQTAEQTLEPRAAVGAFLDRAGAILRSWTGRSAPLTISDVLTEWRVSERDLDATTPGSEAWLAAAERYIAARAEYRRLYGLAAAQAESLRRGW